MGYRSTPIRTPGNRRPKGNRKHIRKLDRYQTVQRSVWERARKFRLKRDKLSRKKEATQAAVVAAQKVHKDREASTVLVVVHSARPLVEEHRQTVVELSAYLPDFLLSSE